MSCEKDMQAKEVTISVNEYNHLLKYRNKFKYFKNKIKNKLKQIEDEINNEECDEELDRFIEEEIDKSSTLYEFNKQANEIYNELIKDECPHAMYLENVPLPYCKAVNGCVICPDNHNICPNYAKRDVLKEIISKIKD